MLSRHPIFLVLVFAFLFSAFLDAIPAQQPRRGPFNQPPRSVRSRDVDQLHVRLELAFDFEKEEFRGRAVHKVSPYKPLSKIEFDAAEMKIERVALAPDNGAQRDLKHESIGNKLTISLDREYAPGETLQLAISYLVSKPRFGAHFVRADKNDASNLQMVWTQSEPELARFWFPCLDTPSDRLTSETVVTAPSRFFVLSNGALESKTERDDGTTVWHWVQAKSHVPYLMSVVVGDFEALEQSWDGIPVVSYVPRGRLADAPRSFDKTPAMMKFFSEKIGHRYPWPKYAQICVDEYQWGGMEHTSATTLNLNTLHDERAHLDVSSVNLVAHELAHQWWGDLITCKDWGELWLNESFATYFANLWTEHDEGADEAAWDRRAEANSYFEEDGRYRRSIVNYRYDNPDVMFDRHTYPKGGRVLHMLRGELEDDQFWRAMRRYCEVNQHRTVETADLRIAIADATGQQLNWFFDQWTTRGGHPEFHVSWKWHENQKTVELVVKQTQKVDELTPLFRATVDVELATSGQSVLRKITVSKAEETFHFGLDQKPARVCFDPRDFVLKKLTAEKSKEEWLDQLARSEHVMCRAQAVEGLAKLPQDDTAREALLRAAKSDAFWGVRQEAVKALGKQTGDNVRQALLAAAKDDAKSQVRREALTALGSFSHDETRVALRHSIANDKSYFAVAEALRALLKVDRDKCQVELLAALEVDSHGEVIRRAACDGLAELKNELGTERILKLLTTKLTPEKRVLLLGALARLKRDDTKYYDQLQAELDHRRADVRRTAVDLLAAVGDPRAIEPLLARRASEENSGVVRSIDTAVEKLRNREKDVSEMRKEVEALRKQNRDLEERLKKLERGK